MQNLNEVINDSARGGFYLTAASVISVVFSFLSILIVARILGSELYGLYSLTLVVPSLVLLFTNPGINQGLMKFSASFLVSGEKNRLRKLILQSFLMSTLLGVIGFLVCFFLSNQFASYLLNRPEISGFVQLTSVLVILQVIFDLAASTFIGVNKTEYTAAVTIVQSLANLLLGPILVLLGLSITGVLIGYIISYFVASSLGLYLLIFKIYKPFKQSKTASVVSHTDFSFSDFKLLIYFGLPLYLSVIISGFDGNFKTILLANFASDYELGNFQAVMNFTTFVMALTLPINRILLPAFAKLENKKESIKDFFKISVKYTSLLLLPIIVLVMIYADEIVGTVYGAGYDQTPGYLVMYFSSYFLLGLGLHVLRSLFNGMGNTKDSLIMTLIHTVVLILLSPILTSYLGTTGLIMTLVISVLFSNLYGLYTAKRKFDVEIGASTVSRIYFTVFFSAIIVFCIKQIIFYTGLINLIIGSIIYLAAYLIILPNMKVISSKELKEIKKIVKKIGFFKYVVMPIIIFEEKIIRIINHKRTTML